MYVKDVYFFFEQDCAERSNEIEHHKPRADPKTEMLGEILLYKFILIF